MRLEVADGTEAFTKAVEVERVECRRGNDVNRIGQCGTLKLGNERGGPLARS
jgi:hypothetical protein